VCVVSFFVYIRCPFECMYLLMRGVCVCVVYVSLWHVCSVCVVCVTEVCACLCLLCVSLCVFVWYICVLGGFVWCG